MRPAIQRVPRMSVGQGPQGRLARVWRTGSDLGRRRGSVDRTKVFQMAAAVRAAVAGAKTLDHDSARRLLIESALGLRALTDIDDARVGVRQEKIDVPAFGLVPALMTRNPLHKIAFGTSGVNIASRGEMKAAESADRDVLIPIQFDDQLIAD